MILCCGEALIDMVPNEDDAFVPLAGGSVFNTAIGLGRQGVSVGMLSGVSNDLFGTKLSQTLADSHVSTAHLITSDRPTTLAFVRLVDGQARYAFYDENTAGRMISPKDMPHDLPDDIDALFFGGISLAVEPCADAYLSLLETHAPERLIMVDPNIRSNFIKDEMRYRARLERILALADILKISDEDLDWVDQSNESLDAKVAKILANGPTLVCLTLGSKGVRLLDQDGEIARAVPPKTDVVDTVGAGDAFSAGFLTILARAESLSKKNIGSLGQDVLQDAINFATRFAADTVTRKGSDPAWRFEL
ncbi:MAG: carbohydrate kinase [Pseudomonadota bacterium]